MCPWHYCVCTYFSFIRARAWVSFYKQWSLVTVYKSYGYKWKSFRDNYQPEIDYIDAYIYRG